MIRYDELNDFQDPRGEEYLVPRWGTYWYQFAVITKLTGVQSILEVGPGRGILGALCTHFGFKHEAIDIVPNRNANRVGDIVDTDFLEKFDLTCAFQVLEHNEFSDTKNLIKAMCESSNKYVYISLPVSKRWLGINIDLNLPGFRRYFLWGWDLGRFMIKKRVTLHYDKAQKIKYHWWELFENGTGVKEVNKVFEENGFHLLEQVRVKTYRYHTGLVYEKR